MQREREAERRTQREREDGSGARRERDEDKRELALTQHWSSASVSPSQEKRRQSFHKCGRPKIGLSAVTAKSFGCSAVAILVNSEGLSKRRQQN